MIGQKMIAMIVLIIGYFVICILLTGIGLGIGYALHWLVPDIGMDFAVLIGLLAAAISLRIVSGIMSYFDVYGEEILINDMIESINVKPVSSRRGKKRKT